MLGVSLCCQEEAGFDENSSFIDVGSGLGKPNFHVAQDPGVEISYGLELEVVRWELSISNHRTCVCIRRQNYVRMGAGSSHSRCTLGSRPTLRAKFVFVFVFYFMRDSAWLLPAS